MLTILRPEQTGPKTTIVLTVISTFQSKGKLGSVLQTRFQTTLLHFSSLMT